MPKKRNASITPRGKKVSKQVIIDAAITCFKQYGVQRTSMDDIAEAAEVSRKTLYRVFEDRPTLIQAVLRSRWTIVGKKLQRQVAKSKSFEQALREGTATAVSGVRSDKLANDIVRRATDHTLEQFMLQGDKTVSKVSVHIWKDAIDHGREAGVIKPWLSDERIVEIIWNISSLLLMREDSPAKQREFVEDVLLPAILIAPENYRQTKGSA